MLIANVAGTSFTDSNVTNNGTYYYVLSMNYGGSESPYTAPVSVTVVSNAVSLVNRYSFGEAGGTNVSDSVGGPAWNGTLPNGGTFGGGQLALSVGTRTGNLSPIGSRRINSFFLLTVPCRLAYP
jgi:hypothetical protein